MSLNLQQLKMCLRKIVEAANDAEINITDLGLQLNVDQIRDEKQLLKDGSIYALGILQQFHREIEAEVIKPQKQPEKSDQAEQPNQAEKDSKSTRYTLLNKKYNVLLANPFICALISDMNKNLLSHYQNVDADKLCKQYLCQLHALFYHASLDANLINTLSRDIFKPSSLLGINKSYTEIIKEVEDALENCNDEKLCIIIQSELRIVKTLYTTIKSIQNPTDQTLTTKRECCRILSELANNQRFISRRINHNNYCLFNKIFLASTISQIHVYITVAVDDILLQQEDWNKSLNDQIEYYTRQLKSLLLVVTNKIKTSINDADAACLSYIRCRISYMNRDANTLGYIRQQFFLQISRSPSLGECLRTIYDISGFPEAIDNPFLVSLEKILIDSFTLFNGVLLDEDKTLLYKTLLDVVKHRCLRDIYQFYALERLTSSRIYINIQSIQSRLENCDSIVSLAIILDEALTAINNQREFGNLLLNPEINAYEQYLNEQCEDLTKHILNLKQVKPVLASANSLKDLLQCKNLKLISKFSFLYINKENIKVFLDNYLDHILNTYNDEVIKQKIITLKKNIPQLENGEIKSNLQILSTEIASLKTFNPFLAARISELQQTLSDLKDVVHAWYVRAHMESQNTSTDTNTDSNNRNNNGSNGISNNGSNDSSNNSSNGSSNNSSNGSNSSNNGSNGSSNNGSNGSNSNRDNNGSNDSNSNYNNNNTNQNTLSGISFRFLGTIGSVENKNSDFFSVSSGQVVKEKREIAQSSKTNVDDQVSAINKKLRPELQDKETEVGCIPSSDMLCGFAGDAPKTVVADTKGLSYKMDSHPIYETLKLLDELLSESSKEIYTLYYFLQKLPQLRQTILEYGHPQLLSQKNLAYSTEQIQQYATGYLKSLESKAEKFSIELKFHLRALSGHFSNAKTLKDGVQEIYWSMKEYFNDKDQNQQERVIYEELFELTLCMMMISDQEPDEAIIRTLIDAYIENLENNIKSSGVQNQQRYIIAGIKKAIAHNPTLTSQYIEALSRIKGINKQEYEQLMLMIFQGHYLSELVSEIKKTTSESGANESSDIQKILTQLLQEIKSNHTIRDNIISLNIALINPGNTSVDGPKKRSMVDIELKKLVTMLENLEQKVGPAYVVGNIINDDNRQKIINHFKNKAEKLLSLLRKTGGDFDDVLSEFDMTLNKSLDQSIGDAELVRLIVKTRETLLKAIDTLSESQHKNFIQKNIGNINDKEFLCLDFDSEIDVRSFLKTNIVWNLSDNLENVINLIDETSSKLDDLSYFNKPVKQQSTNEQKIPVEQQSTNEQKINELETLKDDAQDELRKIIVIDCDSLKDIENTISKKTGTQINDLSVNFGKEDLDNSIKNTELAIDAIRKYNKLNKFANADQDGEGDLDAKLEWLEGWLCALKEYQKIKSLQLIEIPINQQEVVYYCKLNTPTIGVTEKISLIKYDDVKERLNTFLAARISSKKQARIIDGKKVRDLRIREYLNIIHQCKLSTNGIIKLPKYGDVTNVEAELIALKISRVLEFITTTSIPVTYEGKPALFIPFDNIQLLKDFTKGEQKSILLAKPSQIFDIYTDNATIKPVGHELLSADQFVEDLGSMLGYFYLCGDTDTLGQFLNNKGYVRKDDTTIGSLYKVYILDTLVTSRDKLAISFAYGIDAISWTSITRHDSAVNKTLVEDSSLSKRLDSIYQLISKKDEIRKEIETVIRAHLGQIQKLESDHKLDPKEKAQKIAALKIIAKHDAELLHTVMTRIDRLQYCLPSINGVRDISNPRVCMVVERALKVEKIINGSILFTKDGRPYKHPYTGKHDHQSVIVNIQYQANTDIVEIQFKEELDEIQLEYLRLLCNRLGIPVNVTPDRLVLKIKKDDLIKVNEYILYPELNRYIVFNTEYLEINELTTFATSYPTRGSKRLLAYMDNFLQEYKEKKADLPKKLDSLSECEKTLQAYVAQYDNKGFCKHVLKKMQFFIIQQLLLDDNLLQSIAEKVAKAPDEIKQLIQGAFNAALRLDVVATFNTTLLDLLKKIEQNKEKGKEQDVEQDKEKGKEQNNEKGKEQDVEQDNKQDKEENKEQAKDQDIDNKEKNNDYQKLITYCNKIINSSSKARTYEEGMQASKSIENFTRERRFSCSLSPSSSSINSTPLDHQLIIEYVTGNESASVSQTGFFSESTVSNASTSTINNRI